MSFSFEWPRFSEQFHAEAIEMLNSALNKGSKPPVIADKIEVVELEMGTQPPELEIRDIGDLTMDQFRGIFRLTYAGDAHLVLRTKVQANPLNHKQDDIHLMSGTRGMLAAKQPLVVPMLLRLSHFRLNSYVVLVVSKQKGITLVFKTDPLQNVDINSTFDSIAVIQKFIQREIEGQLRQMFREDLPGIIHRLSQQWVKAKVEAPYLNRERERAMSSRAGQGHGQARTTMSSPLKREHRLDPMSMSVPDLRFASPRLPSLGMQQPGVPYPTPYNRAHSSSGISVSSTGRRSAATSPSQSTPPAPDPPDSSFPDIENFDPTYGLRPEGLPTKSVFGSFGRLFSNNKGLADLAEEPSDEDYEEAGSFDMVEWEDTVPEPSVMEDELQHHSPEDTTEYETIPAVGGGTITRPRILHSQSHVPRPVGMMSRQSSISPSSMIPPSPSRLTQAALEGLPQLGADRFSQLSSPGMSLSQLTPVAPTKPLARRALSATIPSVNPYFPTMTPSPLSSRPLSPPTPPLYRSPQQRPVSPDSLQTHPSRSSHSLSTPPSIDLSHIHTSSFHPPRDRRTPQALYPTLSRVPSHSTHSLPHPSSSSSGQHLPQPGYQSQSQPQDLAQPQSIQQPSTPIHKRTFSHSSSTSPSHSRDYDPFSSFPSDVLSTSPSSQQSYLHPYPHDPFAPSSSSPKIVLRPQLNNSISQLSTLSHSNHTLSPYTRALEHFTVRSGPPTGALGLAGMGRTGSSTVRGVGLGMGMGIGVGVNGAGLGMNSPASASQVPVRARRKRTHRLGGSKKGKEKAKVNTPDSVFDDEELAEDGGVDDLDGGYARYRSGLGRDGLRGPGPSSPPPPSEFDVGDMDKYFFRARDVADGGVDGDERESGPPEMHRSHVRRRKGFGVR